MKKIISTGLVALIATTAAHAMTVLAPTQAVSVTDDGSATSVGTVNVTGVLADSGASYFIRERRNTGQSDRQISSFFQFDLSSISVADTLEAGFNVEFTIDYVERLNSNVPNNSAPAILGRVVSGDGWDTGGTDFPLHDWGFAEGVGTTAQDTQTLITDIPALDPTVDGLELSLDVTSIVTSWVNGTNDNYGFVLFIDELEAQGAAFNSPALTIVPEPSSYALLAGMLALTAVACKRRK
ncbi:MAG: PEP-CTERM sorting domain-containing protein [Opitutaceae bacterium]